MELTDLMEESIKIQENDFFKKKFFYSFSSLSKLMWSPAVFHSIYVLGLREEKTESYLVQGKLIHLLLLEEDKFNEDFIISPSSLPSDNTRKIIDRVFKHYLELSKNGDTRENLDEYKNAILDVLKDVNLHQSLTTDDQRISKIITSETISYWDFLKNKGNKTLIDQSTYDFCKNAVDLIKTDKKICDLLGIGVTDFDNKEVYNELEFKFSLENKNYGFKGIIDNLVVDHDAKKIIVNDLKTTSKELKDFSESVEYYSYWIQCIIYMLFVSNNYAKLIENGYVVDFNFVVIDKMWQVYAFPVTTPTLNYWLNKFTTLMEEVQWHYDNKSYDLPYKFANNLVTL